MGGSGSGKSTLIRVLTGELTHYEGDIFIDKYNYKELSLRGLQDIFALIPQKAYLFKDTLLDNMTLGRSIDKDNFDEILHLSRIDRFIKGRLNQEYKDDLSGGQQARISIARELLGDKPIIIMDEAVANLDKKTAVDIERELLQIENLTIIMITHHLYDENKELFDQIISIGDKYGS